MSTPINHHFVSQCQIKQFFNQEGKIFLYDKEKNNFYSRTSSKNIFSEPFSNSIYKNGFIKLGLDGSTIGILHHQAASGGDVFN